MTILNIYFQLTPLILLTICGFWAGKRKMIQKEQVFSLVYYVFAPILVLHNTLKVNVFQNFSLLILFILFLLISSTIYWLYYYFSNQSKNLKQCLAFTFGSTNSGYFGLPLIILTLGVDYEIYGIVCLLGYFVFESLLGYSQFGWKSYLKVPNLISFILGTLLSTIFSFSDLLSQKAYQEIINYDRYGFVIFGMLLLGLSISEIKFNLRFVTRCIVLVLIRSLLWLILGFGLGLIFYKAGYITKEMYFIISMLSLTPISVNSILVGLKKEVALDIISMLVLISTLFSILMIPVLIPLITDLV